MANRTVDQANIVGDTVVTGANEVSQASVEGVENVAASTGLINQVSNHNNAGSRFKVSHQVELFPQVKCVTEL